VEPEKVENCKENKKKANDNKFVFPAYIALHHIKYFARKARVKYSAPVR
jgi:hypothetical protein